MIFFFLILDQHDGIKRGVYKYFIMQGMVFVLITLDKT